MRPATCIAVLAFGVLVPTSGVAAPTINVFHYKYFYSGTSCTNWDSTQWVNYNDFLEEMLDVSDCYYCRKDSDNLDKYLAGSWAWAGLDADLLAVDTHGRDSGSGLNHQAWLKNRNCTDIEVSDIVATSIDLDIALLQACDLFETYSSANFVTFRNLFSKGLSVVAGCWDYCTHVDWGVNTTWNEIGDQLADKDHTVKTAWREGHGVWTSSDDIIVLGSGRRGHSEHSLDCEWKASNVDWDNKADYWGGVWPVDQPWCTSYDCPQLCGYYWTDY